MFKKIKEILEGRSKKMIKKSIGDKIEMNDILIPKRFRGIFKMEECREREYDFLVLLREKKEMIPKEALVAEKKGERVKKNGYCNIVEVLAGSRFSDPMYLRFQRRRWKNIDTGDEYINQYDFHPEGMKVLHEFAEQLKKISRRKFNTLFCNWESIRYLRKEDYEMVQRLPEWV